ncbi:MAG: nucleotide sugar dehydrogenase, partial [Pseudomonadota bacterium]
MSPFSFHDEDKKIAIIGLGYVGLPLALQFCKNYSTIGFDINTDRVGELVGGVDSTNHCSEDDLRSLKQLGLTHDVSDLKDCNIYIVTVPTPIDCFKNPDLKPLISASRMLGDVIGKGDIIIYESTVYPGVTEEICVREIEKVSGLTFNQDFFAGYCPERINPGDSEHSVANVMRVTSGSTPDVANVVDSLYQSILKVGTFKASSIRVAESSKIIENIQRDVNIALTNQLHQLFSRLKLDTKEIIEAASTKWNFMKLQPGMVGGHCISVDPYYLLHKASETGYIPDLILKAREINDGMAAFYAQEFINDLIKNRIDFYSKDVYILGFSFKENCADTRNTKVSDLYRKLAEFIPNLKIFDPLVNKSEVEAEHELKLVDSLPDKIDIALLAVNHTALLEKIENIEIGHLCR